MRDVGTRSVVAIGPTQPPHPAAYVRLEGGRRKRMSFSWADVDTVIVDGRVVLKGGKPTQVKTEAVLEAAQRESEQMLDCARLRSLTREPAGIWRATRYQTGKD